MKQKYFRIKQVCPERGTALPLLVPEFVELQVCPPDLTIVLLSFLFIFLIHTYSHKILSIIAPDYTSHLYSISIKGVALKISLPLVCILQRHCLCEYSGII